MPEYIEREASCKDCIHYDVCYHIEHYGRETETDKPCKKFKSADVVEVVHGRWVEIQKYDIYECLECGYEWYVHGIAKVHPLENSAHYCPNCGAKMDGERRSDNE